MYMKKTYMQPATMIVVLETQPIMGFGSPINSDSIKGGGSQGNFEPEAGMVIETRRNDVWGEEEEEEEHL